MLKLMNGTDFHDLFARVYVLMVGLSFGLGAVILAGGQKRFGGPSFDGPRDLIGWLPLIPPYGYWGLLFILFGLALIVGLGRPAAVHILRFGIVAFGFLAVALLTSSFQNPVAALTGVVVYSCVALLFAILQDHLRVHGWIS